MRQTEVKYLIFILSIMTFSNVSAQTCGFGCLGLSGVYGGYSIQKYDADGLNNYLNMGVGSSSSQQQFNFNQGSGLKLGINIIRADYPDFFFTFKGFYQFLSEEQNLEFDDGAGTQDVYETELDMNNWGIGLDFGIPLFSFIDLKIIEGEMKFFSPKFTMKSYNNNPSGNAINVDNTYTADNVTMGFSVGSGLIFNILEDYISMEVTGMYTFLEIDNLTSDQNGTPIPLEDSNTQFISSGGLQTFIQLNVGLPL